MSQSNNKKKNGQFFTITNPFRNELFFKWTKKIPDFDAKTIIEPFCGAGNILAMVDEIGKKNSWSCFDIDPPEDSIIPKHLVEKRDVLAAFPTGYDVAITNPPYLAKNSATRDGLEFPDCSFDDLYKFSLDRMLSNVDFVAAIVPESFITCGLFRDRLFGVISLICKMFADTDCPVCLALFIPVNMKHDKALFDLDPTDYYIYRDNAFLGTFRDAEKGRLKIKMDGWKFNNPNGRIGMHGIDSQNGELIRFVPGKEIHSSRVTSANRAITRIDAPMLDDADIPALIEKANEILNTYRVNTNDVFLTSFRGLRKDGRYRRRLDYEQARHVLSEALKTQLES